MLKNCRLCDAVGKTIAAVEQHHDADIVIVFTDGTYVALHPRYRYEDAEIQEIDVADTGYYEARHAAVKAGVLTNEEEIEQRKAMERRSRLRAEEQDRQRYEILKRKFG
jgi:hypothetical protein